MVHTLGKKVLNNHVVSRDEAIQLINEDIGILCNTANKIRMHFCGNNFDICAIINGKNGMCSENCKYCAQSSHYHAKVDKYPLLSNDEILKSALYNYSKGILRHSVVTSGRTLTDAEVEQICSSYRSVANSCPITLCASHGLLTYEQLLKLKSAGIIRYHNNLETSRRNFPNICTTHTYDDKIATIKSAQRAGLSVCSGGIMGLGETFEDRIDMVLDLRELGVESVPINIFNPINGTPFEHLPILTSDEVCRIVAIYRFIMPHNVLRLAGGRSLLPDKGRSVFLSGANAAISGDMLTTSGISINDDIKMLKDIGFEVKML